MKSENEIVLVDSPEAASIQTVTGWVSRTGHFWGDNERAARFNGCTHVKCSECGATTAKSRTICGECSHKRRQAKFLGFSAIEWDEVTPLALFDSDIYFFDFDSIVEYAEDGEPPLALEQLQLVLCRPVKPGYVDGNDLFQDSLPEDGEIQDGDVLKALDKLNEAIGKAQPFCWMPTNVRVTLPASLVQQPELVATPADGIAQDSATQKST